MVRFRTIVFLSLILLLSCRKDKDESAPNVTINNPLQNSTIDAGTIVNVKGRVTDDKKITSVSIKVFSMDGSVQIADPISLNAGEVTNYNFDQNLRIGDLHTVSGTYQIIVEASDGTNEKKAYREIIVNEIPRVFQNLYFIQKNGGGYSIDSLNGVTPVAFRTYASDFGSASISNYKQLIFHCGKTDGILEAYSLDGEYIYWNLPPDVTTGTTTKFYFNYYSEFRNSFWQSFAGSTEGRLKLISSDGAEQKNIGMQSMHYASCMAYAHNSYVVGESPMISGGTSYLSYYFSSGFGIDHTTPLPFKPLAVFELSSDELVVLGNNGSQGELRIYDSGTNGLWEQVNIPVGKIYDAVQIGYDDYIIAHESGLLRFIPSTSNLYNLTTGNKAQAIVYDFYVETLYACEGNQVRVYNPITGTPGVSYSFSDSVYVVLPNYNK